MSERGRSERRFVVDTNVFVAAIRSFSKPQRRPGSDSEVLRLLIKLTTDEQLRLVGNSRLLEEYSRLAEQLSSETAELILKALSDKTEVVEVREEAIARCRPHLREEESADVLHAATALQTDAILITNDKDFVGIRQAKIVGVWTISEAIRGLLGESSGG